MNQKQLANVLIKVLGLSLCANSVTAAAVAILNLPFIMGAVGGGRSLFPFAISLAYGIVPLVIGLWLILGTKWFTEKLFKDE